MSDYPPARGNLRITCKEETMKDREKNRKLYEKPRIREIKLETEEAVLASCKRTSTDTAGTRNRGCRSNQCKAIFGS
jgi:hypothetical protein